MEKKKKTIKKEVKKYTKSARKKEILLIAERIAKEYGETLNLLAKT